LNPSQLTTTQAVDFSLFYIIGISFIILIGVTVVMIGFAVRYHRSRHPAPTSQVSHNVPLEVIWTLIPTFIALSMFYIGWSGYLTTRGVPEGAMEVTVTARMWSWSFEYEDGRVTDRLYVPVGRPVLVHIRTADVIHSFSVPAFRVKRDAVPGMDTYVWFVAEEPGSYNVYCTEYCGVGHADMITTVEALPEEEFAAWLEEELPDVARGLQLLQQYGCIGCHSLDGTPAVGPTFQGLYGSEVQVVREGRQMTVTADEDYIRRSIREPQLELTVGYPPVMPAFPQIPDEELEEMVEYLRELQ
jgi:cytochrome c oxidase subunit II